MYEGMGDLGVGGLEVLELRGSEFERFGNL